MGSTNHHLTISYRWFLLSSFPTPTYPQKAFPFSLGPLQQFVLIVRRFPSMNWSRGTQLSWGWLRFTIRFGQIWKPGSRESQSNLSFPRMRGVALRWFRCRLGDWIFPDRVRRTQVLGEGGFGAVYLCHRRNKPGRKETGWYQMRDHVWKLGFIYMFLFLRNKHMHFLSHLHHFATWLAWLTVHSYIGMGDQWIAREQLIKRACEGSARFKVLNMHWSACPRAISSKWAAENSLLRFPIHLLKNVASNQVVGVKFSNESIKVSRPMLKSKFAQSGTFFRCQGL